MAAFERSAESVRQSVEDGTYCGAALAIGVKDELYVKETWGRTSFTPEGTPVNEHTLYDMASVTKIMSTTMLILRCISEGKLDLADRLDRFFEGVPDDKKDIMIYHLLTHTSGYTPTLKLEDHCRTQEDIVPYLLTIPLEYETGTQVQYSCMGFILLAKILEQTEGKPLDELAREEVFEPLGLTHTGYHRLGLGRDYSEDTAYTERNHHRSESVRGKSAPGEWLVGEVHDENAYFQYGVSGNAGVFSDLDDCIRYARMLASHGTLDGQKYLPRCIFDAAIRNYTPGMAESRGLGFHLANGYACMSGQFFSQKGFGHNGFTGPHIFVDPDSGLYVVLLLNRVHPTRDNNAHLRTRRILHTLMAVEAEEMGL